MIGKMCSYWELLQTWTGTMCFSWEFLSYYLDGDYARYERDNMAGGRKSSGKEIFFCVVLLQYFWYVGTAGKCCYQ